MGVAQTVGWAWQEEIPSHWTRPAPQPTEAERTSCLQWSHAGERRAAPAARPCHPLPLAVCPPPINARLVSFVSLARPAAQLNGLGSMQLVLPPDNNSKIISSPSIRTLARLSIITYYYNNLFLLQIIRYFSFFNILFLLCIYTIHLCLCVAKVIYLENSKRLII